MGAAIEAHGGPTEIAIQVFAARFGLDHSRMAKGDAAVWEDLVELPFDSDFNRMSVVMRASNGKANAFTKGAVERVIQSCTSVATGPEEFGSITEFREEVLRNIEALASLEFRVLALASKPYKGEVEKVQK